MKDNIDNEQAKKIVEEFFIRNNFFYLETIILFLPFVCLSFVAQN